MAGLVPSPQPDNLRQCLLQDRLDRLYLVMLLRACPQAWRERAGVDYNDECVKGGLQLAQRWTSLRRAFRAPSQGQWGTHA